MGVSVLHHNLLSWLDQGGVLQLLSVVGTRRHLLWPTAGRACLRLPFLIIMRSADSTSVGRLLMASGNDCALVRLALALLGRQRVGGLHLALSLAVHLSLCCSICLLAPLLSRSISGSLRSACVLSAIAGSGLASEFAGQELKLASVSSQELVVLLGHQWLVPATGVALGLGEVPALINNHDALSSCAHASRSVFLAWLAVLALALSHIQPVAGTRGLVCRRDLDLLLAWGLSRLRVAGLRAHVQSQVLLCLVRQPNGPSILGTVDSLDGPHIFIHILRGPSLMHIFKLVLLLS